MLNNEPDDTKHSRDIPVGARDEEEGTLVHVNEERGPAKPLRRIVDQEEEPWAEFSGRASS